MALNMIFASTTELHRERPVPTGTQPGVPLLIGGRPAVTLTAEGAATLTKTSGLSGGVTSVTYTNGGVGNLPGSASVAFDGTWEFAVTGAVVGTLSEAEVFITAGGVLTLTTTGNTHYGWTDYPRDFRKEAARAAVRIGR